MCSRRITALFALCTTALAAAPLVDTGPSWRYGTRALALDFAKSNGAWIGLTCGGRTVARPPDAPVPCRLKADQRWLPDRDTPARLTSIRQLAENTLATTVAFAGWTVTTEYALFPGSQRIRRRATIAWNGAAATKLRGLALPAPVIAASTEGQWFFPGAWPPTRRQAGDFQEGRRRSHYRSPMPLVYQFGAKQSLLCAHDLLQPDADSGDVAVTETVDGLAISQAFHTLARMQPGSSQRVGDVWFWLVDDAADKALLRYHELLGDLDCVVPKDRPSWLESAILYSFHPGGTIGSGFRDLGGFVPATALLDRIADLGCNSVWIMPIEDKSVYNPRDYYTFQPGLGTPEQYRALVARAHELDFHVLQDIVPHGGSNTFPRAKAHPEWLVQEEDGSTLGYWCFDFNWPEWRAYMADVARHYVREYDIDGYRVDACNGSKIPNWNPLIPYARASTAKLQGGLNMLRGLRRAVKETKPERGAILAESNSDVQGAVSDAIYDFDFCYSILHDLRKRPAAAVVQDLRQWLHEQGAAGPSGLLRLRHIESHDSLRSQLWYGLQPQRALMALSAFIPGIPLVYHEAETGSQREFRTIFRLRKQFPELNGGSADYLSVPAPPGVFSCLRRKGTNRCLVLINFNDTRAIFANGESDLELPPFAYRILRDERVYGKREADPKYHPLVPSFSPHAKPDRTVTCGSLVLHIDSTTGLPRVAQKDGRPVTGAWDLYLPAGNQPKGPARIKTTNTGLTALRQYGEAKLRTIYDLSGVGTSWEGPIPEGAALAIPMTQAKRWRAEAGEGLFEDHYRVSHPAGHGSVGSIYWHPQGTNVIWDSLRHPFSAVNTGGMTAQTASGDFRAFLPTPPSRARWFERVGDDQRLTAVIAWSDPQSPADPTRQLQIAFTRPHASAAIPPPNLVPTTGGWQLGNTPFRLRLASNGAITELGNGLVRLGDLYTDAGFAPIRDRYAASNDVEAYSHFAQTPNGLRASFRGKLRGARRFERRGTPVAYAIDYQFTTANSFRMRSAVRPAGNATGERAFLALCLPTPNLKTFRFERDGRLIAEGDVGDGSKRAFQIANMGTPVVPDRILIGDGTRTLHQLTDIRCGKGHIDNVFIHGTQFFLTFLDTKEPPAVAEHWRWLDATVTPGDATPTTIPPFPALEDEIPAAGLLRHGSFEIPRVQPISQLTQTPLPGLAPNTSWRLPTGGRLVADDARTGQMGAETGGLKGNYRLWRQELPTDRFPVGSRWRLTAWAKGKDLVAGDISWQVGVLRFAVTTEKTQYVSCPSLLGTFDWQQIRLEWTVPPGLKSLATELGTNGCAGTIWFDDVQLERLDQP